MIGLRIIVDASPVRIEDAAQIWAEATAARDGATDVAPLEVARPVIAGVIEGGSDPLLFTAIASDQPLGFALTDQIRPACAELRYLAVRPNRWGRGVACQLLDEIERELGRRAYASAELWVYRENERAIALYEKYGWRPQGEARRHALTGRSERRYALVIGAAAPHTPLPRLSSDVAAPLRRPARS
jgi:ribosomal protein S18 acetylase RimI-like enzyme